MDAKMSEAERVIRSHTEYCLEKGLPIVATELKTSDISALLSELDRLREFSGSLRALWLLSASMNIHWPAKLREEFGKLDARATCGEGT